MSVAIAGNPKSWSVDQVASFLEGLELTSLVKGFRENAVNGCDLLSLTDDELKSELGCTTLQVKKIRKNLAVAGDAPAPAPETTRSAAHPSTPLASYPAVPHAAHASPPPAGYPAVVGAPAPAAHPPVYAGSAPVHAVPAPAPLPTAGDPHAASAAAAAQQAAAATAALHGYQTATRNLQQAAAILEAVRGNLATGQAISTVGMISGAVRGARRGFGPGGGGGLLARSRVSPLTTLLQSGKLSRANEDVKRACSLIQAAMQAVPGGTIPTIQPALMRKGATGLFVNLLVGGVASQTIMMNNFSSNKAEVDQMLMEVKQALAWLGPRTREAQAVASSAAAGGTSHNMHALNQSMANASIY